MSSTVRYLIDFIALTFIYIVFFLKRWRKEGGCKLIVHTLMYIYLSFVLYFTLMPILVSLPFLFDHPYVPMHMRLFGDYLSGYGDTVRQIVLNVIMMVPFGFLLPLVRKQKFWSCVLWTFLFSLTIELVQPLLSGSRSSDITDLVTNTVGGAMGYFLYLICSPLLKHIFP